MKASTEKTTLITLQLTEEEARFLKALVQNPLCPIEEEDPKTARMRSVFWGALSEISTW